MQMRLKSISIKIAFSGAREFLDKYKEGKEESQIIGHFGMGFFSAFMVADRVEIDSLSFKANSTAIHWDCEGQTSFEMNASNKQNIGTEITLHINKENENFLDEAKLKELVKRYSNYLPVEIQVNGKKANEMDAIWNKAPANLKDEDYNNFYKELFPMEGDPLFHVHFSVDYPFNLKGVIFFPKNKNEWDVNKKGRLQLYCNNVFVSDNIIDIVPQYLNLLQGVIDSPDIPLNISRSFLQGDPQVKKIGNHIVTKIVDKLEQLFKKEREKYETLWEDTSIFVKFGSLNDEKFYDKVKNVYIFKNLAGKYKTIEEYKTENALLKDKIIYTNDPEKQAAYIDKFKDKKLDVIYLDSPIDNHFVQHLEMKMTPLRFVRVDSDTPENIIANKEVDYKKEEEEQKSYENLIANIKKALGDDKLDIKIKDLGHPETISIITISEQMRRMSDMTAMMGGGASGLNMDFHTLILNKSNNTFKKLQELEKDFEKNKEKITKIAQNAWDLALLQSGQLKGDKLTRFSKQITELFNQV